MTEKQISVDRATAVSKRSLRIGITGPFDLHAAKELLGVTGPVTQGCAHTIPVGIANELVNRGHDVTVFTLSSDPRDVGVFQSQSHRLRVNVAQMRTRIRWKDFFLEERKILAGLIKASDVEVVHAHWTYEFALAALRVAPERTVVTVHDWAPAILRYQPNHYRLVRLMMQQRVLRQAPVLTANSSYIAGKISRHYKRESLMVPNGFRFPSAVPDTQKRSESFSVGSVNNGFGRLKNVQRLLEAFRLIRQDINDAQLLLVGTGYETGGAAHHWAVRSGVDSGVQFLGPLPATEIPAFMRSICVLVHPSLEESFGMTLIEAIAAGTLVIGGSNSGAVPWVLGGGTTGVLTDVTSADAIAAAVLEVASSITDREEFRHACFEDARNRFSIESVVDQYEAIFHSISDRNVCRNLTD
jgi:L-malate glycosyltransferase